MTFREKRGGGPAMTGIALAASAALPDDAGDRPWRLTPAPRSAPRSAGCLVLRTEGRSRAGRARRGAALRGGHAGLGRVDRRGDRPPWRERRPRGYALARGAPVKEPRAQLPPGSPAPTPRSAARHRSWCPAG